MSVRLADLVHVTSTPGLGLDGEARSEPIVVF
jgi:hypothetical protein